MTKQEQLAAILKKLEDGAQLSDNEQAFLDASKVPPKWFRTEQEIADHYGLTRRSLRRWVPAYPEAFQAGQNGYDAEKIAEARRRFLASGTNVRLCKGDIDPNRTGGVSLEDIKLRKAQLECDKLSTQIDILRGLYVRKSTVVKELRVVLYALKEALLRIGSEVCYQTSGKTPAEAQEIINEAVRRVLTKANEIDFERFEAAIDETGNGQSVKARMPAARETNGAQKAS